MSGAVATSSWRERREWTATTGSDGPWREQANPATGTAFAHVRDMSVADARAAVGEVADAYEQATVPEPRERAELLRALAVEVRAAADALAELDARCTGKLQTLARKTALAGAAVLEHYAQRVPLHPFSAPLEPVAPGVRQAVDRVPVGVVACILPWNFLLSQTCARLAMLLGSGNAIVLKGPELAQPPLLAIEELARAAGWPAWACSVVTGGPEVGQALVEHPRVSGVCFTGGVSTGMRVARTCADDLKRVVLELGGRTPVALFADADPERAVPAAVEAAFSNAGQACNAGVSLLVERSAYAHVADAVAERARDLRVGDPLDPATEIGPLVSAAQRTRVAQLVDDARAAGATVLTGGEATDGDGFFYAPTVVTDVPAETALAQEEVFGPVVVIEPFDDERELVARVNGSVFGLAASVWTADAVRAERLRRQLRVGVLWINVHGPIPPNAPWGGFRHSGLGRLYGDDGLDAFTEPRASYEQLLT